MVVPIRDSCAWSHHVQPFDILHRLEDKLPRLCLAEMIEILLRGHARLIAAVLWNRIRNLDQVRKATFFRGQRLGGLELRDVASMVRWIDLMRSAVLGLLLHGLLKSLADRFAVGNIDLAEQPDEAAQSGQRQVFQSYISHPCPFLVPMLSISVAAHRAC